MAVSVFDLFKIGIGPSSSHTVGPMRAARLFALRLKQDDLLASVASVRAELYGSLGATGKGHGSDKAVILGLEGDEPATVDVETIAPRIAAIRKGEPLKLAGIRPIAFVDRQHLLFYTKALPFHPNGLRFTAFDANARELASRTYYSVGGGFVVSEDLAADGSAQKRIAPDTTILPLPFHTGGELLAQCKVNGLSIAQVLRANERHWRDDAKIDDGLLEIWRVMQACVTRGLGAEGTLPGGLKVRRRAADWHRKLTNRPDGGDPLAVLDWVNLFALAVNEENAAGGRVVTAPTNGAAGIIPSVLHYYRRFIPGSTDAGIVDFLLTAGAIGILYKENASISGAEVGCQGEVGVACSMAAGGLAAVLGGTPEQVENAAEIGMEHHLGLTCDPVGGLVQIPCIERNAVASVQAINAARMALAGDGTHHVSLDQVIKTMRETGADMKTKYKETARGGLALNVIEC
jgi:L-serine dehydratase